MRNSYFCNKDLIKYLIVIGLIYAILKVIPNQPLENKDLILVMVIIVIGFVCVDCFFFKKMGENFFNTTASTAQQAKTQPFNVIMPQPPVMVPTVPQPVMAPTVPQPVMAPTVPQPVMVPQVSCAAEVDNVKKQLDSEIANLKAMIAAQKSGPESDKVLIQKYFDTLTSELKQRDLLSDDDINAIKLKVSTKLLTMDEVMSSLEKLKASPKKAKSEIKNDFKYNELPEEFYNPIGDKISNDWSVDNEYAILNTNKWQVPTTRPPVCINSEPCKVCPTDSGNFFPVSLKNWDQARIISDTKINQKWAADQK